MVGGRIDRALNKVGLMVGWVVRYLIVGKYLVLVELVDKKKLSILFA